MLSNDDVGVGGRRGKLCYWTIAGLLMKRKNDRSQLRKKVGRLAGRGSDEGLLRPLNFMTQLNIGSKIDFEN